MDQSRVAALAVAAALTLLAAACTGSSGTSSALGAEGLVVPATYTEACANEGSICLPGTTGPIPAALKRSLHFPAVEPGARCPATPGGLVNNPDFGGVALGDGLVRPILAARGDLIHGIADISVSNTPPWLAIKTLWFSVPAYQGPFVIRAKRLDRAGQVALGEGATLAPLVVPPGPTVNGGAGYRTAPGGTWVMTPGCYGWQVDGLTFSEVIVVDAVLPPGGLG